MKILAKSPSGYVTIRKMKYIDGDGDKHEFEHCIQMNLRHKDLEFLLEEAINLAEQFEKDTGIKINQ